MKRAVLKASLQPILHHKANPHIDNSKSKFYENDNICEWLASKFVRMLQAWSWILKQIKQKSALQNIRKCIPYPGAQRHRFNTDNMSYYKIWRR